MTAHAARKALLEDLLALQVDPAVRAALEQAIAALDFLSHVRIAAAVGSRIVHVRPISGAVWAQNLALLNSVPSAPALDLVEVGRNLDLDRRLHQQTQTADERYSDIVGVRGRP